MKDTIMVWFAVFAFFVAFIGNLANYIKAIISGDNFLWPTIGLSLLITLAIMRQLKSKSHERTTKHTNTTR